MELLWLLLPIAAASGWWAARRSSMGRGHAAVHNADYFKGLNYLIDDQPDQAIEVFTRMADVDRDTAEIHLALGNLFRRRGEVDRAIYIHGSLIARTHLTTDQRQRAMLELGEDYLRAGLFDRAEELFQKLLDQPDHTALALSRLIYIFQQEKDWRQAIAYSDRLERISGESKRRQTAHFCCELAEEANARHQADEARTWLLDALARHSHLRERVERLQSIRGVGEVMALTWALEIGEPERFSSVASAVSYCGLCSALNESAGKTKRGPLSKQRNAYLQSMLIEAAKLAPRWNKQLASVYTHERERGANPNRATLAVARKLVAYLLAVDKSGEAFTPQEEAV